MSLLDIVLLAGIPIITSIVVASVVVIYKEHESD
jgi:hypothetical protein